LCKRTELVGDRCSELPLRLTATLGREVVPENGVVRVAPEVEREILFEPVDVREVLAFTGGSELLERVICAGYIRLMMLAVVQLHDLATDVRLECCIIVGQFGK